jgi:hypothetical protein
VRVLLRSVVTGALALAELPSVPDHDQISVTNCRWAICSRVVRDKETRQPEKRKVGSSTLP